ncbi:unnamed protein product [Rhizophagus irregularis]|nr:unnamed protein product [Rhizophagus irregularis]
MQTYPDYVYRPNKRKNEKRRQARKNAVATFNSQDTTTTNNYEGGEAGPIQIPIYINPKLYWMFNTPIKCPICKAEDDTNSHLGFYFSVLLEINRIIKDFKANLSTKISLHADQRRMTYLLPRRCKT